MKIRKHRAGWLAAALACGIISYAVSAFAVKPVKPPPEPTPTGPLYQIEPLGTLGGYGWPGAINEAGWVVGTASSPSGQTAFVIIPEASSDGPVYFRDADQDGQNDLMILLPSGEASSARDVNDHGWIVGYSGTGPWGYRSTLWLEGVALDLGEAAIASTAAGAVNNLGLIACGEEHPNASMLPIPACVLVPEDTNGDGIADNWFRDDNADRINDLLFLVALPYQNLPGEDLFWTYTPEAMNDAGQVVVKSVDGAYVVIPDYTDSDGDGNPWYADVDADGQNDLMIPLPELEGGAYYPDPRDINAAGQIVGGSDAAAVIWELKNGIMTVRNLGVLSKSVKNMSATAINDVGEIAGNADYRDRRTAFLLKEGKMYDLAALLVNGTGWTDLRISELNNQGSIVGQGLLNGITQAFVAIPVAQP